MAYQELIRYETYLMETYGSGWVNGWLWIACNSPEVPVHYDAMDDHNPKRFTHKDLSLDGAIPSNNMTKNPQQCIDQGQPPDKAKATIGTICKLAQEYPYIVYTIKYQFTVTRSDNSPSYVLGKKPNVFTPVFYPFMRPFFHRAESIMDDHLLAEMMRMGKELAEKTMGKDTQGVNMLNNNLFSRLSSQK
jgi:hypothetical protein